MKKDKVLKFTRSLRSRWSEPNHHANRLTTEEIVDLKNKDFLVISPTGEMDDLVFSPFRNKCSCGGIKAGTGIDFLRTFKSEKILCGGVLSLDDCFKIREHMDKVLKDRAENPLPKKQGEE